MAKVTDTVAGQVEQVKKFVDSVRDKYKRAYDKALEQSRISELGKLADDIAPAIRTEVSKGIDVAQKWLDTVNQSLAEKALPQDRRKVVKRMKLDEKSGEKSKAKAKKTSSKSQKSKKPLSPKKAVSPRKAAGPKKAKNSVSKTARTTASKKTTSVKKRSVKK